MMTRLVLEGGEHTLGLQDRMLFLLLLLLELDEESCDSDASVEGLRLAAARSRTLRRFFKTNLPRAAACSFRTRGERLLDLETDLFARA